MGAGHQPGTPKNLQIHTTPPATLAGTNLTTLTWNANPEPNLAGYEVVMRETTAPDWTSAIGVGNVTTVTLDISKDNVQFGLRAVDQAGQPQPGRLPAGGRLAGRDLGACCHNGHDRVAELDLVTFLQRLGCVDAAAVEPGAVG